MAEFTEEEPTKKGIYLVKNDNFQMAAELVEEPCAGWVWNTTELEQIVRGGWMEGTTFKRVHF
jgi:hypothetical protein